MVLLLYFWETLKKWTSAEEMRRNGGNNGRGGSQGSGSRGGVNPSSSSAFPHHQFHQQQESLDSRRLDYGDSGSNLTTPTVAVGNVYVYSEGGWGWIVCACAFLAHLTTMGCQFSGGALRIVLRERLKGNDGEDWGRWLGPFSFSISCLSAPFVVNICRRRQTRLVSILGGCLFPLSLVLTSFGSEIHHIFLTFGVLGGIGSSLVRESSNVFLGYYFRRRRQFVEQVVMAGTGVGVTLFSLLFLSLRKHVGWEEGFQVGGALSSITALLPIFYRSIVHTHKRSTNQPNLGHQPKICSNWLTQKFFLPIGGDFYQSLRLFCVPQIKPLLWATAVGSAGFFAPLFLLLEVSHEEKLSGGSLLLLQTHIGLGLSLGVIVGAIIAFKRQSWCTPTTQTRSAITALITGFAILAISSLQGYYAYSLAAWAYGIALGSHLYTTKILAMELTRTKHWERVWALLQGLMATPLLGSIPVFMVLGKDFFYIAAGALFISGGILGVQIFQLSNCSSPALSSETNDSPIPPPPPPPPLLKFPVVSRPRTRPAVPSQLQPLTRSLSLNQPPINYYHHPAYCQECFPIVGPAPILRSQSLPPTPPTTIQPPPPKFSGSTPDLKRQEPIQSQYSHKPTASRLSSERFPDLPIEPQFFPVLQIPLQQQEPAFTRFHFDSSMVRVPLHPSQFQPKVSTQDFEVEPPQFNSLRRPPRPHHHAHFERRGSFHTLQEQRLESPYYIPSSGNFQ